jgi:hypothetical protein
MDPVLNKALLKLSERAKELECLHKVEEAIKTSGNSENGFFNKLLDIIPMGMQFSTVCEVRITYGDKIYKTDEYHDSRWMIRSELHLDNEPVGEIKVVYIQAVGQATEMQFLTDEQKLLDNIAARVSCWLFVLMIKSSKNELSGKEHNDHKNPEGSK